MNWLPRFSIERPITVVMVFISICVLGVLAWIRIPLELFPSGATGQSLYISVPYPDSQPNATEEAITLPIEDHLSDLEGLKKITSRSRTNNASINVEFHRSIPISTAYNAVVDRMERALLELPEEAQEYMIFKWDISDAPVLWMGIGMEGTQEEKYNLLYNTISPKLGRVSGVGGVDAWGSESKKIFIDFARDSLMNYQVNQYQIMRSIRTESFQMPNGRLVNKGRVNYVRSLAKIDGVEGLKKFPARDNLPLSSVATIQYRLSPSSDIARINGKDGAGISIRKEADANTVDTVNFIKEKLDELSEKYPVEFFIFFDQGDLIQGALDNLIEAALAGGFFAIIVLYLFLRNLSLTILIAACIPFTLIMSVSTIYKRGGSLNLLSLMGLMLAVGMVVDNAIVVVESIYSRRLQGEGIKKAAVDGANEVGLAISLSTLTTIIVFLPVILMNQGTEYALFLAEIGFPIIVALTASLIVALGFTPLTTTFLKTKKGENLFVPKWVEWLTNLYRRTLQWVLRQKPDSILALCILSYLTLSIPVQSVGCSDNNENLTEFEIRYTIPPQFSYYERLDTVKKIENIVKDNKERWGVEFYFSQLNASFYQGRTSVYLDRDEERGKMDLANVIDEVTEQMPEIAGVKTSLGWSGSGSENRRFDVYLFGEQTTTLEGLINEVAPVIENVEGVMNVEKGLEEGGLPELQLIVNREEATRYGISAQSIGWTVASALRSNFLPEQMIDGNKVDVIGRFQYSDRSDLERLLDFPTFSTTTNQFIPLKKLVNVESAPSLRTIRRTNRKTSLPIGVNLTEDADIEEVRVRVNSILQKISYPTGYGFMPPFDVEQYEDQEDMASAWLMSMVFVFLIMGSLFESFLLPLAIITTIPMAALGAFWALFLTETKIDNLAGIGLVILIGVVVNNGIVLIENVNRLREQGFSREIAIVEGGVKRLRPILMTAMTTVFGLLPMAMGGEEGGISYAPLGRVMAGGLTVGTFLTLFFVPLMYILLDEMRIGTYKWIGWLIPSTKKAK